MKSNYLGQKAAPWVSAAVLLGGLTSACLLFIIVRIDRGLQNIDGRFDRLEESIDDLKR
jgi:hypothetical protein